MTKKLTRSDVEELAAYASQKTYAGYCPPILPIPPGTLAELARVWLRVNDAPVADSADDHNPCGPSSLMWAATLAGYYKGQRVRLVPEADSGGDRG